MYVPLPNTPTYFSFYGDISVQYRLSKVSLTNDINSKLVNKLLMEIYTFIKYIHRDRLIYRVLLSPFLEFVYNDLFLKSNLKRSFYCFIQ